MITDIIEEEQNGTGIPGEALLVPPSESIQDKMFIWTEASIHINRMIREWDDEVRQTESRRKQRKIDIDVDALRKDGSLDEDETIVPVRVVDTNISREQPTYINYIKNSRRICTFRCVNIPNVDSQTIEEEFTRGMTYTKWEIPFFKVVDGAMAHGWDAVEVVYDESKPFNVGIEHVGHEHLIFPQSMKNIQNAPRILRVYDVSLIQLKSWVDKFGFDSEQVQRIIDRVKDTSKENENVRIYKLFFKKDGIVYCAWCADKHDVTDWLKAPYQHSVGIGEMVEKSAGIDPITQMPATAPAWESAPIELYPIFLLNYRETEEQEQIEHEGRTFLDSHKQEAHTSILSGFINGLNRAASIYGSQEMDDGSGDTLKSIEDVRMTPGRVFTKKVNFFSPPYPDPMVLGALQYLDVANSNETNQPNFAAINREDSRKTATEMNAAKEAKVEINSVQLTLYSTFIREVYSFSWLIVQSQALANNIQFLLVPVQIPMMGPMGPVIDPMTMQPQTQTIYQNDSEKIGLLWELRAAGDVDVIKRAEIEQKMQQDMPLIMSTPLAVTFMTDYIKLRYPDSGDRYAAILTQMPVPTEQLAAMQEVMKGMIQKAPQLMEGLTPEEQQMIAQLLKPVQQPTTEEGSQPTKENAKPSENIQ